MFIPKIAYDANIKSRIHTRGIFQNSNLLCSIAVCHTQQTRTINQHITLILYVDSVRMWLIRSRHRIYVVHVN